MKADISGWLAGGMNTEVEGKREMKLDSSF